MSFIRSRVWRGLCGLALVVGGAQVETARPAVPAGTLVTDCTNTGLQTALNGGGLIQFSCPSTPATIVISTTLNVTAPDTTLDGAGQVTLQGSNTRVLRQETLGSTAATLTVENLSIEHGRAIGAGEAADGGAIESLNHSIGQNFVPTLNVDGVTFVDDEAGTTSFPGNAYDFGGGAIYSSGGFVHVSNSSFTANSAQDGAGGAIHILRSSLTVAQSVFSKNSALGSAPQNSQGGAIYVDGLWPPDPVLSVSGSSFYSNTTFNSGGAIYFNLYENNGPFTVDSSTFENNAVVGGSGALGGAISGGGTNIGAGTGNPAVTITRSLFSGNSARKTTTPFDGSGGALAFAQRAVVSIANSTFYNNRADGSSYNANGGALYVVNNTNTFQLDEDTFADNVAGWVGGAVTGNNGAVSNTLFSGNSAANGGNSWDILQTCAAELADDGHNLQYPPRNTNPNTYNEATCFQGKSAISQRTLPDFRNPLLGPLTDNGGGTLTMAIGLASPALDAGNDATCAPTDQRGVTRPQGSHCDMGAFELARQLSLSPSLVQAGAPGFTLTVDGDSFSGASQVLWNSTALSTTLVSAIQLQAAVAAGRIASPATAQISVSHSSWPAAPLLIASEVRAVYLPWVGR